MTKLGSTLLCAALVVCGLTPSTSASAAGSQARTKSIHRHPAVSEAERLSAEMTRRSALVHGWLRKARVQGDRRRARCLDRKVSRLHALERLARPSVPRTRAAVVRGASTRPHLLRLRNVARLTAAQLDEAARCGRQERARTRVVRPGTQVRVLSVPRLPPMRTRFRR